MTLRLTDKRLVLMALDAAIQWESELRDGSDDEQAKECQRIIDGYRRVLARISGGKLTISEMAFDRALEGSRNVGIEEISRLADEGKIPIHTFNSDA